MRMTVHEPGPLARPLPVLLRQPVVGAGAVVVVAWEGSERSAKFSKGKVIACIGRPDHLRMMTV